jgi:hypothetical protein
LEVSYLKIETVLFKRPGDENTEEALRIAEKASRELGVGKIIVASTSGKTAMKAVEIIGTERLIVVSHAFGFYEANVDEMEADVRRRLNDLGVPVITTSHTFAGFARAVRREFKTYLIEDIVASVLRTVCEGFKVSFELVTMAADAGYVLTGERVITVAGTGEGADTVVLMKAANSHNFFSIKVEAVLAKPLL